MIPTLLAASGILLSLWFTTATLQSLLPASAPIVLLFFSSFLQLAQYYYSKPGKWWLIAIVLTLYLVSIAASYVFLIDSITASMLEAQKIEQSASTQRIIVSQLEQQADIEREIAADMLKNKYRTKAAEFIHNSDTLERLHAAVRDLNDAHTVTGIGALPLAGVKIGVFLLALVLELVIAASLIESRHYLSSKTAQILATPNKHEKPSPPLAEIEPPLKEPPKPLTSDPIKLLNNWPFEFVTIGQLREITGCSEREARKAIDDAKKRGWLIKDKNRLKRKAGPRAIMP